MVLAHRLHSFFPQQLEVKTDGTPSKVSLQEEQQLL